MTNAETIWAALTKVGVSKVAYNPCNKLNAVMEKVPDNIDVMNITKESAGLGLCFGRSLAGKRSAMFIQNTGLGNLVTELYTLQKLYQVALPIFVSWRGYYNEPIEAQILFGQKVEALLQAIDVEYTICKSADDLEDLDQSLESCFAEDKVKVYLLSPEVWETNSADYHVFGSPNFNTVNNVTEGYSGQPTLTRKGAINEIMEHVGDEDIVLSQIGFPSKEVYNSKDRAENFYMLGALGAATEVGIGLAMEVPGRHVYVIDGDGSFFFNPNQLCDLAVFKPENLTVICLDNGSWGSTGNQPTLSSSGMNLSAIAASLGIDSKGMTDSTEALARLIDEKPQFLHYLIQAGNDKKGVEIPLKALEIKERFMNAVSR
ncbi:MAG: hypothetical protein GKR96_03045 [Gammaproteobacteria bacterium]|nr:hypothetical protein [Gammaproteobacteria bacterium]